MSKPTDSDIRTFISALTRIIATAAGLPLRFVDDPVDSGDTLPRAAWKPSMDEGMRYLTTEAGMGAALERYYKPDRLDQAAVLWGSREKLIKDNEKLLAEDGWLILASRHESLTGRALWAEPVPSGLAIYESTRR